MLTFNQEKDFKQYLIDNFESIFNCNFVGQEVKVKTKRIDLVGETDDGIYIIEVKPRIIDKATIKQLESYMENYKTSKRIYGIAIAPKISLSLDHSIIPPNITLKTLPDVAFDKCSLLIVVPKEIKAELVKLAKKDNRSLSNYIVNMIKINLSK